MNRQIRGRFSSGRLLCAVVVVAGVLGGVATRDALAQLTPQQKQEVHQHYERATRAYDVGKYQEAIEEYQKQVVV